MKFGLPACVIDGFLLSDELEFVESAFCRNLHLFTESKIKGRRLEKAETDREIRSSRYLVAPDEIRELFDKRLRLSIGDICCGMGYNTIRPSKTEIQFTISSNGDFFRRHNDDSDAMMPSRLLSFAYYFHKEKNAFHGGELIIYPPMDGLFDPTVIKPERNKLVVFPSFLPHEIRLVSTRSDTPLAARVTVNGWIHDSQSDKEKNTRAWINLRAC